MGMAELATLECWDGDVILSEDTQDDVKMTSLSDGSPREVEAGVTERTLEKTDETGTCNGKT